MTPDYSIENALSDGAPSREAGPEIEEAVEFEIESPAIRCMKGDCPSGDCSCHNHWGW